MNHMFRSPPPPAAAPIRHRDVSLCGVHLRLDPRGAAFLPQDRILLVSDLHLEKASSIARRGYFLPPYDTGVTLARLAETIAHHAPRTVVCLGDSFHDPEAAGRLPAPYRDALGAMMRGRDWIWITGNHDPAAPAALPGQSAATMSLGPLTLRHEPAPDAVAGEIAGHLHPAARMVRRGQSVRRPCFASDQCRLVMPAFGCFTGGLNVRDRAFAGLFRGLAFHAHLLGAGRLYSLAGAQLRAG